MKKAMVLLALSLFAGSASAQLEYGFYLGGGVGSFEYEKNLLGVDPASSHFSDTSSSWKLFSGYDFSEHFGAEISIGSSGEVSHNYFVQDPFFGTLNFAADLEFMLTTVRLMSYLRFADGALFAGVGMFDADVDIDRTINDSFGGSFSSSVTGADNGATALLGVQWQFSQIMVRLEYEWFDIDSQWWDFEGADTSLIGVAFAYRY